MQLPVPTVLAAAPEKVAAGWLVTAESGDETAWQLAAVYADTAGMLEIAAPRR